MLYIISARKIHVKGKIDWTLPDISITAGSAQMIQAWDLDANLYFVKIEGAVSGYRTRVSPIPKGQRLDRRQRMDYHLI